MGGGRVKQQESRSFVSGDRTQNLADFKASVKTGAERQMRRRGMSAPTGGTLLGG